MAADRARQPGWPRRFWAELGGHAAPHDRFVRLIIIERIAKGTILVLAAVALIVLNSRGVVQDATEWAQQQLNLDAGRHAIRALFESLLVRAGSSRHLTAIGLALIVYAALEMTQGVGLHLRRRWAEYLTVLATGLLIPYEVVEVLRHPTLFRGGALILNLAVVGYLAWKKRLFIDV